MTEEAVNPKSMRADRPTPRRQSRTKLGNQRWRFALEYLVDANATQAAIRAGYSPSTAYSQGQRLLKDVEVRRMLVNRRQQVEECLQVKFERVLQELHRILVADPLKAFDETGMPLPLAEIPEDLRRAIRRIDIRVAPAGRRRRHYGEVIRIRFWSKTEAAQQLLRVMGVFGDRIGVPVNRHAELLEDALRATFSEGHHGSGDLP